MEHNRDFEGPNGGKWSNLFSHVKTLAAIGGDLKFVPPEINEGVPIARMKENKIHKMTREWDIVVVLFIAGVKPQLFHVQWYVKAQWPQLVLPKVVANRNGYFLIKCSNVDDINLILNNGPYSMGGRPIMLCK